MIKRLLATAAAFLVSCSALAEETQPAAPKLGCESTESRQFDFWIGEWTVTRTGTDTVAGSSVISLHDGGCVILEAWTGATGYEGHSINAFDSADGKWHQYWVGNSGDPVHYIGAWTGGKMEFLADDVETPGNARKLLRMIFEPLADGKVRQSGGASSDGGKTWADAWDLTYARKSP